MTVAEEWKKVRWVEWTPFKRKFVWWPVMLPDGRAWLRRVYVRRALSPGMYEYPNMLSAPIYYTDEEVIMAKLKERV